jgi:hypothetical protein
MSLYTVSHNLLNILVQIANKMGLQKEILVLIFVSSALIIRLFDLSFYSWIYPFFLYWVFLAPVCNTVTSAGLPVPVSFRFETAVSASLPVSLFTTDL